MIHHVKKFIENNGLSVVAITGGAGAGKTYLSERLEFAAYHIDSGFIGDSAYRKELLERKKAKSEASFIDATNQYNWWDWNKIEKEVRHLARTNFPLIVEGNLIGPPSLLEFYDAIIFIDTHRGLRYDRLKKRDGHKRSDTELADRWVITNKSENSYYKMLFDTYADKIYLVDSDYDFKG